MDILINLIIGILSSGIVALGLVYFVFWKWKPNIEISRNIAMRFVEGKAEYKIKLINKSKYPANDVFVELWKKIEYKATSNSKAFNESVEKSKLSTNKWLTIEKFVSNKKIKETKYAPHCITIKIIDEDVESILKTNNAQSLVFKISVKHGLSNISSTFSMEYNDSNCLKEGRFIFGNSLEVEKI